MTGHRHTAGIGTGTHRGIGKNTGIPTDTVRLGSRLRAMGRLTGGLAATGSWAGSH